MFHGQSFFYPFCQIAAIPLVARVSDVLLKRTVFRCFTGLFLAVRRPRCKFFSEKVKFFFVRNLLIFSQLQIGVKFFFALVTCSFSVSYVFRRDRYTLLYIGGIFGEPHRKKKSVGVLEFKTSWLCLWRQTTNAQRPTGRADRGRQSPTK